MRIGSLNLNGLRSANKKGYRDWIFEADLDLICMQELRMQLDQMDATHQAPEGWSGVQADAEKKGYSGVAIWSKAPSSLTKVGIGLDWADKEGRVVHMSLPNLHVYSIYIPSGTSGSARQELKDEFLEHLLKCGQDWLKGHENVLICSDVNIAHTERDIHNPKGNKKNSGFLPHEREWVTRFLESGWVDVYRELHPDSRDYSWWSQRRKTVREENKGWRLDYHFASPALAKRARQAYILDRSRKLSDHAPVVIDYDI